LAGEANGCSKQKLEWKAGYAEQGQLVPRLEIGTPSLVEEEKLGTWLVYG
jgi:hypothetical protein